MRRRAAETSSLPAVSQDNNGIGRGNRLRARCPTRIALNGTRGAGSSMSSRSHATSFAYGVVARTESSAPAMTSGSTSRSLALMVPSAGRSMRGWSCTCSERFALGVSAPGVVATRWLRVVPTRWLGLRRTRKLSWESDVSEPTMSLATGITTVGARAVRAPHSMRLTRAIVLASVICASGCHDAFPLSIECVAATPAVSIVGVANGVPFAAATLRSGESTVVSLPLADELHVDIVWSVNGVERRAACDFGLIYERSARIALSEHAELQVEGHEARRCRMGD